MWPIVQLHAFEAKPVDDSDLYTWDLRLYDFESDQAIAADLRERGMDHVTLRIIFPQVRSTESWQKDMSLPC